MSEYSKECLETFLKNQSQLFDEPVAESLEEAEWFLGEPNYKGVPEMPMIQVYDTKTKYYLDPTQSNLFLEEHDFRVVDWRCDNPVENVFN